MQAKLEPIVLRTKKHIIISSLGPLSGLESVAQARETKRALASWQMKGKESFVPDGRKANCSKQKKKTQTFSSAETQRNRLPSVKVGKWGQRRWRWTAEKKPLPVSSGKGGFVDDWLVPAAPCVPHLRKNPELHFYRCNILLLGFNIGAYKESRGIGASGSTPGMTAALACRAMGHNWSDATAAARWPLYW